MNRQLRAIALALAVPAAVAAVGFLADAPRGSTQTQPTIALLGDGPGDPLVPGVVSGGQAAATALGDTLSVTVGYDASTIDSLVAEHVAAIAVDNEEDDSSVNEALGRARKAGIPTLSFEERYSNSVWVNNSSPAEYAHALGDALASQMKHHGQFIIVPCRGCESIVHTWLVDAETYIRHRYPRMHRVGVVYGGLGNGPAGTIRLRPVVKAHPHLRGLIFLYPGASYTGPPQLAHLHKIGKIFSAGNGADCPPLYIAYAKSVLAGSAEMVCGGDPVHLGYLTVWAADHLARGHTLTLMPGSYDVGGPVGTVVYYAKNEELRLGQPVTITKANLAQYGISR